MIIISSTERNHSLIVCLVCMAGSSHIMTPMEFLTNLSELGTTASWSHRHKHTDAYTYRDGHAHRHIYTEAGL